VTAGEGGGFAPLLRSELTKLLSVRRWLVGLAAMSVLTVGFGLLSAAGGGSDANEHPDFVVGPRGRAVHDDFYFVHGPVTGDATVTARVESQRRSHPRAQAGLMLKRGTESGSRYVSIAVTPDHGVRFDSGYAADTPGTGGAAPLWLRLRRVGSEVRGYASADGRDWRQVGTARLPAGGGGLEAGLFVSSPDKVHITRTAGGTGEFSSPTLGRATFADVSLGPAGAETVAGWRGEDISSYGPAPVPVGEIPKDVPEGKLKATALGRPAGSVSQAGGTYTITGSGAVGPAEGADDSVQAVLFGTMFGLMALAAVAVLFATSEYKRHLVWTTFAASPRRRSVLAAKALALAGITFALGLVTSVVAYFVGRPASRSSGLTLPAYAPTSIGQPGVLRAIVGNAVLLVAFALFGLALGMILRRSSGAIAAVFALCVVPLFAAAVIPAAAKWLMWLTPAGGFAVQRAKPPSDVLAEPWSRINPWVGLGVACVYAAVSLGAAAWLLERRDA
jgi:hypothetical protein